MNKEKFNQIIDSADTFTETIMGFLYWGIDIVFSYTDKKPPRFLYHSDRAYKTRYPD